MDKKTTDKLFIPLVSAVAAYFVTVGFVAMFDSDGFAMMSAAIIVAPLIALIVFGIAILFSRPTNMKSPTDVVIKTGIQPIVLGVAFTLFAIVFAYVFIRYIIVSL